MTSVSYQTDLLTAVQKERPSTYSEASGSFKTIGALILPSGNTWSFAYTPIVNGSPSSSASVNYGQLTQVTMPTGGTIQYQWSTSTSFCGVTPIASTAYGGLTSRTFYDPVSATTSSWTYVASPPQEQTASPLTHQTTDPLGNVTNHILTNYGFCSWFETETDNYDNASNLVKKATTVYEPITFVILEAGTIGALPTSKSIIWPNQLTSSQTFSYDTGFPATDDNGNNVTVPYGNQMSETDSDYGNGGAGSVLRKISTAYMATDGPNASNYLNANLLRIPYTVQTLNSSGTLIGSTTYAYDETSYVAASGFFGKLTTVTRATGTSSGSVVSHTHYDGSGMVAQQVDPKSYATSITYQCSDSLPYEVTNPLGQTTTYTYHCDSGLLASYQDPNDSAAGLAGTVYNYDSSNNVIGISYPDGGSLSVNYNGYSNPLTITSRRAENSTNSEVTTTVYDGLGRTSSVIAPNQATINTTYDLDSRVSRVSNSHFATSLPTDGTTQYSYDALNRVRIKTQPDNSTQQWNYAGNVTTFIDEASHSWARKSDALGRLTNVAEPTGAATGYTYDALNDLISVIQNGVTSETPRTRGFIYDGLSRLTSSTNPETGTISYVYDANGNVTNKTDARGITATYSYDALNRLTQKSYSDGITPAVIYGYDSSGITFVPSSGSASGRVTASLAHTIGRLAFASSTSGGSLYAYSYDVMGRLTNQWLSTPSFNAGTSPVFSMGATFDLAGNVTSLTYPDGRVLNQEWNGAGELQQIADQQTLNGQPYLYFTPQSTYYPDGSSNTVWRGNGVASGVDKNNRLQPWAINASRIGASAAGVSDSIGLMLKEYCYGPSVPSPSPNELPSCPSLSGGNSGNIQEIIDGTVSGHTQTFTYDSVNRLTLFSQLDGSVQQNYIYDSFGNRGAANPTTNRLSNLPCASSVTPFDAAGNQLCDTDSNGMIRQYSFDAEDRITQIAVLGNAPFESYLYDANGGRIQKTNANGTYTEYVDFNGQPMAEFSSDGSWSDYIFDNGERLARADNYDVRIHMSGTNCSGCSSTNTFAGTQSLTAANGTVVQSGDLLTWRQYQDGVASGGISIGFTLNNEGTSGVLVAADGQKADADTRTGAWYLRVADLSAYAGLTIGSMNLYNFQGGAPGNWDIYLGDIVLVHANGTSLSLYDRSVAGLAPFTPGAAESNVSVITEKVFNNANPQTTSVLTSTTFYEGDQVGSAILLTNSGGWPIYTDVFYPFGAEATAPLDPNHYKFTGKERDAESGLDYFGARYYGSSMGRFMSPDWSNDPSPVPWADLENPQSLNLYAYVNNNPLSHRDPNGHQCAPDTSSTDANGTVTVTAGACTPDVIPLALAVGHHFIDQAITKAEGAGQSLAGQFFRRWTTGGPLKNPGVHTGYPTAARLNTQQIQKIVNDVKQATGRDMSQWTAADIEKAVDEVRSAGGDTGKFLSDIAEENPTVRTVTADIQDVMAAAQNAYNATRGAVAPIVEDVESACASEPNCGIPPP